MMCAVFYGWLLLDSIVFYVPHFVACISTSLLSIADNSFNGYTIFYLSIHQLIDIWVVCSFWLL